jgi:hypothetical protein
MHGWPLHNYLLPWQQIVDAFIALAVRGLHSCKLRKVTEADQRGTCSHVMFEGDAILSFNFD